MNNRPVEVHIIKHLEMLLEWLDSRIALRVERFRYEISRGRSDASLQQLYIPHEEVDWHLQAHSADIPQELDVRLEKLESISDKKKAEIDSFEQECLISGKFLPLVTVKDKFGLTVFERDILVVCLAPEFDRKYDRIFAYLQDDVTRKRPSVCLILDLLCENRRERLERRGLLDDNGALMRYGLLEEYHDPQSPSGCSGMARFLSCSPELLLFCFGADPVGKSFRNFTEVVYCNNKIDELHFCETADQLVRWARYESGHRNDIPMAIAHVKASCLFDARLVVERVCALLSRPLLVVNIPFIPAGEGDVCSILYKLYTCAKLLEAVLMFDGVDVQEKQTERVAVFQHVLPKCLELYGVLTIMTGQNDWRGEWGNGRLSVLGLSISIPEYDIQKELWNSALKKAGVSSDTLAIRCVAESFSLSPVQILSSAQMSARIAGMKGSTTTGEAELTAAARMVAARSLVHYGIRIEPRVKKQDLILPEEIASQVSELCRHARHANRVYDDWGFGKKVLSRGVSALLYGPPGTGKTMTAEVIAGELNLELYKVDLSMVVSKYIGETEKNLGAVFDEARSVNAVLFFDEADALFGRRTEISDSHDRYANIEVSYLLQRIEAYEGIVLLASNLKGNIDDAFLRRFRFIIELPFPDCEIRHRIWLQQFPSEAPVEPEIELSGIAEKYSLSGGNIKNAALHAAFAAAAEGVPIGTDHLLFGIRQEYRKMGKTWTNDTQRIDQTRKGILSYLR